MEVVNLRFADAPIELPAAEPTTWLGKLQFTKDDIMYVIELGVMAFLGLIVLFMVVRPLVKRVLSPEFAGRDRDRGERRRPLPLPRPGPRSPCPDRPSPA